MVYCSRDAKLYALFAIGHAYKEATFSVVREGAAQSVAHLVAEGTYAVKLTGDAYFVKDLIGCSVVSTDGTELGTMIDVYETNANDVYVVKGSRMLSAPALKRLLHTVDIENKRIVFDADVLEEVGLFED